MRHPSQYNQQDCQRKRQYPRSFCIHNKISGGQYPSVRLHNRQVCLNYTTAIR